MKRILHILVILTMVLGMLPLMALPVSAGIGPEAICVPWQPSSPAIPHYTYTGKAITLKGIARSGATQYYWDYGDGSPAMAWTNIANPYNLGVKHTYTGIPGQLFIATLHVKDGSGTEAQDTYPVKMYLSTDPAIQSHMDVRINIAIDEGLWNLHTTMSRNTYAGPGGPGYSQPYGYWAYNYYLASTGAAVDAFQLHGSKVNGDYNGDPYVETVQRAINYLLYNTRSVAIAVQTAGNPDTNGNGIGLVTDGGDASEQTYVAGICMVALASSGVPNYLAPVGPTNVYNRKLSDIVQDEVDFFAWGQTDAAYGNARGGWRYAGNSSSSDTSTTQWPVLGMTAAIENMGSTVPAFVKTELAYFVNYVYHSACDGDNGAYGYSTPNDYLNITKSAAGIICHEFMGTPLTDAKIQSAIGYCYRHWSLNEGGWGNNLLGNSYAMYAMMKSMRIPEPDILKVTEYICTPPAHQTANQFDWYYTPYTTPPTLQPQQGLATYLVGAQQADGHWQDTVGSNALGSAHATGWGVLILMKGVSIIPPVAEICDCGSNEYDLNMDIPLDGSCSYHPDPSRSIVSYEWDFDNDGVFDDATGINATITGGFAAAGYHPVGLRVTDNNPANSGGPQTDIFICQIYVHPPCLNPNADAGGPYIGWIGTPVQLDGSGTWDPDTAYADLTFEWDLDNDGTFDDATGDKPTYPWAGAYHGTIALKVTDDGCTIVPPGAWYTGYDIAYATVDISDNHPPTANAGGPYTANPNATIALDGSGSSDPDAGDIIAYAWDLDNDGLYDDSNVVNPPFTVGGVIGTIYPICLMVTDLDGEYDIDCTQITVTPIIIPPGTEVGGDVYPTNKLLILTPWIVLAIVIAVGATILIRRRQNQS
jgi:hypothetical protein